MSRHIVVFSLCTLLAACAAQSPPRTDPLADLVGKAKIVDSPTRVIADAKTKSLALIVSTSSATQIKDREDGDKKYLEGYVKTYHSKSYGAVKSMQESVGPRKLVDKVASELRQRFKSVTVVADLAEFGERKRDVAAVVDLGMEYNASANFSKSAAEYTTDVSLIMFDKQVRKIGIANGKATEAGERSTSGDMFKALLLILPDPTPEEQMGPLVEAERKSRASAFKLLNASLDRLVQK
jgi:hypothetical protein